MKNECQSFLSCCQCYEVKSTVNLAMNEGWQCRDGVWLCQTCLCGTRLKSNSPLLLEEPEPDWLPDAGWC